MSGRNAETLDWITRLSAGAVALALAAPLPAQAQERGKGEAVSSDLRVFFDDSCLTEEKKRDRIKKGILDSVGPTSLVTELVLGVGTLALKSFGDALVEAGSPRLDRAHAISGGMFFANARLGATNTSMNLEARCVHIIRDGFLRKAAKQSDGDRLAQAPAALKKHWTDLGLRSMPSFYAQMRLETSSDAEKFRAVPVFVYVDRFMRSGKPERDFLVSLEFSAPGNQREPDTADAESGIMFATSQKERFATGALQFVGLERRALLEFSELKGLETGWMPLPGADTLSTDGAFNLEVDLVELKHGDPLLVDLGMMLGSDKVADAARQDMQNAMQRGGR